MADQAQTGHRPCRRRAREGPNRGGRGRVETGGLALAGHAHPWPQANPRVLPKCRGRLPQGRPVVLRSAGARGDGGVRSSGGRVHVQHGHQRVRGGREVGGGALAPPRDAGEVQPLESWWCSGSGRRPPRPRLVQRRHQRVRGPSPVARSGGAARGDAAPRAGPQRQVLRRGHLGLRAGGQGRARARAPAGPQGLQVGAHDARPARVQRRHDRVREARPVERSLGAPPRGRGGGARAGPGELHGVPLGLRAGGGVGEGPRALRLDEPPRLLLQGRPQLGGRGGVQQRPHRARAGRAVAPGARAPRLDGLAGGEAGGGERQRGGERGGPMRGVGGGPRAPRAHAR
mmetsp:Transcript_51132/g.116239  ORF Transcript_51132/g.116239 Transcript_51132/m.116239 type:complete len:344 (+) Transcript_51132:139-1170(+)